MRILNWREFAALAPGHIFSFYTPCGCRGLWRKGETITDARGEPIDFLELDLLPEQDHPDAPIGLAECESRWGVFDYQQQFCVLELADTQKLYEIFNNSMP